MENYKIYVAKSPYANLYTKGILSFLQSSKEWMEATNPSIEEVQNQLNSANERISRWTGDKNEADIWDSYTINQYQKYILGIEFLEVSLSAEPVSTKKPKI